MIERQAANKENTVIGMLQIKKCYSCNSRALQFLFFYLRNNGLLPLFKMIAQDLIRSYYSFFKQILQIRVSSYYTIVRFRHKFPFLLNSTWISRERSMINHASLRRDQDKRDIELLSKQYGTSNKIPIEIQSCWRHAKSRLLKTRVKVHTCMHT